MIYNGKSLLDLAPIEGMLSEKHRAHGVSYGMSEAGYDIRIKQELFLSENARFSLASAIERFQMPAASSGSFMTNQRGLAAACRCSIP